MTETEKQAKKRIQTLYSLLKTTSKEYYQTGNSRFSDSEYDALEKELKELEKKFPQEKIQDTPTENINDALDKDFSNVVHKTKMLSLKNLYSKEELLEWYKTICKKTKNKPKIYCDLKIDGMAISLFYKKGIFHRSLTRGDGEIGEDLTKNIQQIESLPKEVNYKQNFELRGEIFFPKRDFEKLNKKRKKTEQEVYKNPRNATVGIVRMKNADISDKGLQIFIYDMLEGSFSKEHNINLMKLKELGFFIYDNYLASSDINELWDFFQKVENQRIDFPFQIDGIVCRINDKSLRDILGIDSKFPKWAVAIKFPSEQAKSKLLAVENFIGRSGMITPVACLEPVNLLGTEVKKASLHNYEQIRKLDIRKNDYLIIEKGGDIIPKVVAVDSKKRQKGSETILPPKECPNCKQKLSLSNTKIDLYCTNDLCSAIILGNLEHFASKKAMNIETLGPSTIKKFFKNEWLRKITDIYHLNKKKEKIKILDGFGEKSLENLFSNIEKSKNKSLDKFIYALGIPHIGENSAKQLASISQNIIGFLNLKRENLEKINNFGEIMINTTLLWIKKNKNLLWELKNLEIAPNDYHLQIQKSQIVAITGTLSIPREEWKNLLEEKGFQFSSSITQKTNILIAEKNSRKSSKIEKAKKWDIQILTEEEFKNKFF